MRRITVSEFASRFDGYMFIYTLENQTDDFRRLLWCVTDNRQVFNNVLIAHNPDCIQFSDDDGRRMQVDNVECILIHTDIMMCDDLYFDVVCKIPNHNTMIVRFLASKCK